MLKQHCLTMAKFIFHIEPLLLHFEVKFDYFEWMNSAHWWFQLIIKLYLDQLNLFSNDFDDIFANQIMESEMANSNFLIAKVEDLIVQMQDSESTNSMIHVSYCLDHILNDPTKKVLLSLILHNTSGSKQAELFWMFLMVTLQSMMTNLIDSSKQNSHDYDLPLMTSFEEEEFMSHLNQMWNAFHKTTEVFHSKNLNSDLKAMQSIPILELFQSNSSNSSSDFTQFMFLDQNCANHVQILDVQDQQWLHFEGHIQISLFLNQNFSDLRPTNQIFGSDMHNFQFDDLVLQESYKNFQNSMETYQILMFSIQILPFSNQNMLLYD